MPYTLEERREKFRQVVRNMNFDDVAKGDLNFFLTIIVDTWVHSKGKCYDTLSDAISTFECAKLEYYDKVVRPYENEKEKLNGPVHIDRIEKERHWKLALLSDIG